MTATFSEIHQLPFKSGAAGVHPADRAVYRNRRHAMAHTPFPAEELTPAQTNLLTIADWMVKVSVGAILGLVGAGKVTSNGN